MHPMPALETERLVIRPFSPGDLEDAYKLFDVELRYADLHAEKMESLPERARWLEWIMLNYEQLAMLNQPPYGDQAIVLKEAGELIGSCGYVPCLSAFEQMPNLAADQPVDHPARSSTEFGLFYAISPAYQRRGYAVEAAQALIDYAFEHLRLKRIIAETDYNNIASLGVMRKLGMQVAKNPQAEPPWLQIVGALEFNSYVRHQI